MKKIDKFDIEKIFNLVSDYDGIFKKNIITKKELTPERCFELYHSEPTQLVFCKDYYTIDGVKYDYKYKENKLKYKSFKKLSSIMSKDISIEFHKTFEKLGWEYEELKYFKKDNNKYVLFMDTLISIIKDKGNRVVYSDYL